jgi:metal-responsive CopG/Arc/MetJ family transcriptional regulator
MPQVSLYIDRDLYKEVESIAKRKEMSLSGFVSDVLKEYLNDEWPEEFTKLIGSVDDETFVEPEDLPWTLDAERDEL